jgi:hypothetical protein
MYLCRVRVTCVPRVRPQVTGVLASLAAEHSSSPGSDLEEVLGRLEDCALVMLRQARWAGHTCRLL